ncbi:Uncharacterised protein [Mycobacteroides abscessus subsp. bolletii]|uniref:hypothetical protein n=1 Tax=Mycobacteroides abscessus TaxID=36809 RepID=UPI0009A8C454|nr:hypothetical protein [Mycobacteroides abscessus]SKG74715.1 Uncharacterised protein [Mycobacteroides abscessus subsp. bolletii]SKH26397.1 Uncharacterised protein [Mycobacteroides abscessus subsp. bolletii]
MTVPAVVDRVDETIEMMALVPTNHFHLEPRCRVCRNDDVRVKVNNLLATGTSYAMVVRALGDDNAALAQCDQVTIDSVRNHCARHFPVQNAARATYREILERRARENQLDFVDGVATAITPMAFLETVMAKSYEGLVDPETAVDVNTGILAASRLQSIIDCRAGQPNLLEIRVQLNRIINAVRSTVPHEMWTDILRALGTTTHSAHTGEIRDFYDEVDDGEMVLEPAVIAEFDDEHDSLSVR